MNLRPALAALMLTVCPQSGAAQNLIINGGFQGNTSGWAFEGTGQLAWSPLDALGQPGSGSAQLTNASTATFNGISMIQCVPVAPGSTVRLGVRIRMPSGPQQSLVNEASAAYRLHANAGCTAPVTGVVGFGGALPGFDTWQPMITELTIPANATALELRGRVIKFVADTVPSALFDDYCVAPIDNVLIDGFENSQQQLPCDLELAINRAPG